MKKVHCQNASGLNQRRRFIAMEKWKVLGITQSENLKIKAKRFFKNFLHSKPKLERIENLVVCHHNNSEFDANLLKYFTKMKNLFIGYSTFDRFKGKLPHLEHLKVN